MVSISPKIKRPIQIFVVLICTLAIYVFVGSLDRAEPAYHTFLSELPSVDPELNAYNLLIEHGLLDAELLENKQEEWLKQDLKYGEWSPVTTESILVQYRSAIDVFRQAASMPYLQFEAMGEPNELPEYVNLMNGVRLLLLEAKYRAKAGQLTAASQSFTLAWRLSEKIKRMNDFLISYMIGIAIQDDALKSLHWLVLNSRFDTQELLGFIALLNGIPSFSEQEFKPVMQAELRFSLVTLTEMIDQPFQKRWDSRFNDLEMYIESGFQEDGVKERISTAMQVILPKFYYHLNENLNSIKDELSVVVAWSGRFCSELDFAEEKEFEWFPEVTWKQILLPNQKVDTLKDYREMFKTYLLRRCMAYTQIEAVKAILNMQLFAHRNGYNLELDDLVLLNSLKKHPLDYFDGSNLRYSPENRWFYSLGLNAEDNLGSARTCYFRRCIDSENCKNNPTFPIDFNVCDFSEMQD